MADLATPSVQQTGPDAAAAADARIRLASLDEALLTLLAKRLAHALLLDVDDRIEAASPNPASTRVDSAPPDSHS